MKYTPRAEDDWTTPDAVLLGVWSTLARAAERAKEPWHSPTLCTVDPAGAPAARTVILRATDRASRTLACHTDARSPKLEHIAHDPRVAWHFYDPPRKVQLRAVGVATVHTIGPLADQRWAASTLSSRRCYLAPHTPGHPTPDDREGPDPNLPDDLRNRVPTEAETRPGRANFAVIETRIAALDWLYLKHDGHRRARFEWNGTDKPRATWTMP
ncbi:MAG: pyridoxamine 5'-phosphate oxidase family protein [Planctomycetota bacterium]